MTFEEYDDFPLSDEDFDECFGSMEIISFHLMRVKEGDKVKLEDMPGTHKITKADEDVFHYTYKGEEMVSTIYDIIVYNNKTVVDHENER